MSKWINERAWIKGTKSNYSNSNNNRNYSNKMPTLPEN